MEILEEERSVHKALDIQYDVHFSNSDDCSSSSNSRSALIEDMQSPDDSMDDSIRCLSASEQIDDAYHNRFALNLSSKLHKSVSFVNFDIPKFELGNLDNNNNLMKQKVDDIVKKHDLAADPVHESCLSIIDEDENL